MAQAILAGQDVVSSQVASNGDSPHVLHEHEERKYQYPGIPTTCDGAEAVVHVEIQVAQAAGAYPITSSTTMGGGFNAAVMNGMKNLWGDPLLFFERAVNLGSGVSPLLPVLFLMIVSVLWLGCQLHRLDLVARFWGPPRWGSGGHPPVATREDFSPRRERTRDRILVIRKYIRLAERLLRNFAPFELFRPAVLAATMIAREHIVHALLRRLSTTALRCLTLLHLLWPAIRLRSSISMATGYRTTSATPAPRSFWRSATGCGTETAA